MATSQNLAKVAYSEVSMAHRIKTDQSMTEGPIFGKMMRFTFPIVVTGLLQVLYNASDMIVVGNFSPKGGISMGAVGSCGSLINLIVNVFLGLSVGVGIAVAQQIGAGRLEKVKKTIHTAALMGLVCGIAIAIFGFFMAEPLLRLMATPESALEEAVPYMKAYFVGVPAGLVYNFLAAGLRSSGDTKRPLIFLSLSGLLNVIVNVVMVVGFGMGAVGVGIATTVAQYASMIMIIVYMMKIDGHCRLMPKEIRIDKKSMAFIIRNGLPAGLQSLVFSLSNVLIQSTINTYGDITYTGNAAAANIEGFIYVAMNAFYQAAMTFTGQNVGAGKIHRVKRIALIALASVTVVGLVLGGAATLLHEPLLSIYEPEQSADQIAVRAAGMLRMEIICLMYFLCGVMDVLGGVMRGMGRPITPMVVSVLGSCVLRIIWIYTVCPLFPGQISVLYLAYPITWTVTALGHLVCCLVTYRKMRKDFVPVIS